MRSKVVAVGPALYIGSPKHGAYVFYSALAAFVAVLTVATSGFTAQSAPSNGWQTIKDKTGVCQMSVPANWSTIPGTAGQVASPEHIVSVLLAGFKRSPAPMTDAEKHQFAVDRIIEDSAKRWLYITKPVPSQKIIAYHVNVPIAGHVCAAILTVKADHSEEEIKKIADSVGAAK
jgi:hypothetical protein